MSLKKHHLKSTQKLISLLHIYRGSKMRNKIGQQRQARADKTLKAV